MIIQVGQAIGALRTIALLLADSIAGAALMRSQGRAAWRALQPHARRGPRARRARPPTARSCIFGGALLLTPGFCTDILGALFLLPPTRAAIRAFLLRQAGRRFAVATPFGGLGGAAGRSRRPPRRRGDWDVEGTAHEVARRPRAAAPVSVDPDLEAPRPAAGDGFSDAVTCAFGDPARRRLLRRAARARGRGGERARPALPRRRAGRS